VIFDEQPSLDLIEEINTLKAKQVYEKTVFFYELLPEAYFVNNSARTETYDEAIRRGNIIEKTYLEQGYSLEKIPATAEDTVLSRHERMKHILKSVFPALRQI
jgi:predicted ATPase